VASGITNGILYNFTPNVEIMQTYRMSGNSAPSSGSDGIHAFDPEGVAYISHSQPIDVYLMAHGSAGTVRVDV
jgi:hypothetical protein